MACLFELSQTNFTKTLVCRTITLPRSPFLHTLGKIAFPVHQEQKRMVMFSDNSTLQVIQESSKCLTDHLVCDMTAYAIPTVSTRLFPVKKGTEGLDFLPTNTMVNTAQYFFCLGPSCGYFHSWHFFLHGYPSALSKIREQYSLRRGF